VLHGEKDRIVPFAKGKLSAELLRRNGYNVEEFKVYPRLGHFGILTKREKVASFLNELFLNRKIEPAIPTKLTRPVLKVVIIKKSY
jgi:pimeloyl-ACP methyl ester carboxylesterase